MSRIAIHHQLTSLIIWFADFPGVDSKSTGRPEGTQSGESFSLVSPYSSVSKPPEDSPLIRGEGIPVPGWERN